MPANPPPVANNTRDDDKPLPKTTREGASEAKRSKKDAVSIREGKGKASTKAKQKQDKEAENAVAPLGKRTDKPSGKGRGTGPKAKADDSDDDKPLVKKKILTSGRGTGPKAKVKAKAADDSDDDKPLVATRKIKSTKAAAKTDDSDDDKPLVQPKNTPGPRVKAKQKFKNVNVARQRIKRKDEGDVSIQEIVLGKPKKRAKKSPPTLREEEARQIIQASKKAATGKGKTVAPRLPAQKKKMPDEDGPEQFYIGDSSKRPKNLRVR